MNIPFERIICSIEDGILCLFVEEKEVLRQKCSLIMRKAKPPKSNLNKDEQAALKALHDNDSCGTYECTPKISQPLQSAPTSSWHPSSHACKC